MALWIVATPIGTLDDLSPRAREVLRTASVIASEDTRTTWRLLSALDIPAPPMVALHAHNEGARADELARRAATEQVVLVSEAGTPGISDPGREVVQACLAADVEVRSVPGPCALASALAASGLPAAPSTFLGFPPRSGRTKWAAEVLARQETLVVYEAPGRVGDLLGKLADVSPEREVVVCRELSKRFEEVRRGTLRALADRVGSQDEVLGEHVLVIGPDAAARPLEAAQSLGEGSLKEIAAALAARWGVKKRDAYEALLKLEAQARG